MDNLDKGGIEPALFDMLPTALKPIKDMLDMGCALEEIRIRVNRPVQLVYSGGYERLINIKPSEGDCAKLLINICSQSIYACEDALRQGYITVCGCRIGLCGRAIVQGGAIKRMADVTAFNIRIAKEIKTAAANFMHYAVDKLGKPVPVLIISPPGVGKTTLLRDIARRFGDGVGVIPRKVCVVDERNELAGCINGVPKLDLGSRTDVLSGCPKTEGMLMAIRSMSPEVLLTDELGGEGDASAALEALNCGIALIASAHASSKSELWARPSMERLIREQAFKHVMLIERIGSSLRMTDILDDRQGIKRLVSLDA